jgi:hypothetical protein
MDGPLALDAITAPLASPQVIFDDETLSRRKLVVDVGGELRAQPPALTDQHPGPPADLVYDILDRSPNEVAGAFGRAAP